VFFRLLFSHNKPPLYPLRPVMMSNTHSLRITATAGTKLVGVNDLFYIIIFTSFKTLQPLPSSFIQYYWIKPFVHCPIFLTAVSLKNWAFFQSQCGCAFT